MGLVQGKPNGILPFETDPRTHCAGLRSISLAYSRISLQDICTKLGLESPQDAAGVVAKAVVDGVIDATIDYDQQFLGQKTADPVLSLFLGSRLNKAVAEVKLPKGFPLQMSKFLGHRSDNSATGNPAATPFGEHLHNLTDVNPP